MISGGKKKKELQPGLTEVFSRGERAAAGRQARAATSGLPRGISVYIDNKKTVSLKNIIAVKENIKRKNKRKTTLIIMDGRSVLTNKSAGSIIKKINSRRG